MGLRDDFRAAVSEALDAANMTQVEFSKRAGMTPKHINLFLHGVTFTSPEALDYWAFLLDARWEIRLVDRGQS